MNYIRGAVNAISAPYQYYKELPPINPSTLTGAIDVIVIQRPGSNGDTELACSPFHVRFGKWQVLRPSDKKVSISVNGQPIPYHMKIGEAGEAFFVFETDDDVPADLITSPILQPTRPEDDAAAAQIDMSTDRFGTGPESDHQVNDRQDQFREALHGLEEQVHAQISEEPDFLDLNASEGQARADKEKFEAWPDSNVTPTQNFHRPAFVRRTDSHNTIQQRISKDESSTLPSPPPSRSPTPEMNEQDKRVDEALKYLKGEIEVPEVEYLEDVALDVEGYHSHSKESSSNTIGYGQVEFPSTTHKRTSRSSASSRPHETNNFHLAEPSSRHHNVRATSEPPPDHDETHHYGVSDSEAGFDDEMTALSKAKNRPTGPLKISSTLVGVQEYSWDWGAFPTPSPVKTTFGKGGRYEGGALFWKGKAREESDVWSTHHENSFLGVDGKLSAKSDDETTFTLSIADRTVKFQLALIPPERWKLRGSQKLDEPENNKEPRGRTLTSRKNTSPEVNKIFSGARVSFKNFLEDESLVLDPTLIMRWEDGRFITRQDKSPLMDALVSWRKNTIEERKIGAEIQETEGGLSPEGHRQHHSRSKSAPPQEQEEQNISGKVTNDTDFEKKPSSLSWVQWWNRSRQRDSGAKDTGTERPPLRGTTSAPPASIQKILKSQQAEIPIDDQLTTKLLAATTIKRTSDSAPALPSTPVEYAAEPEVAPTPDTVVNKQQQGPKGKKYVKTLRLTSDQLKSLNLKPGANSITFSISSGVVACTARIFVWDYTDLVVVSDIDGTITKSDGLGHVFFMIGRDWTHLGVAKLYTDIARNGYKIMYLTSRAIGQADSTRGYLRGIKQNDYQLPEGPVVMSPDRLIASLHREVIMRKPEVFKMACLRDIQRLFGESAKNPFYAGFGNRITDALSYRSVNVPSARIFTIDSSGEVKMELLELAGYKSSYIHMHDLVDQMFPPIHKKWSPEYTDFNYWKLPLPDYPLPDLTPPSPSLSTYSDASNQSALAKLKNFRLMGSRANSVTSNNGNGGDNVVYNEDSRSQELKQMSSFERLVSGLRRSVSPSSLSRSSYAESEEESDADGEDERESMRNRRRSMTSMPGSLDDLNFGIEEEEEVHWEGNTTERDRQQESEGHDEVEFDEEGEMDDVDEDEDLVRATTEMKKIPFF